MQRFAQEARTICRRAGIASEKVRESESDLIRYFVKNWRLEYVKTSEEEAAEIVLQNAPAILELLRKRPAQRRMLYDEFQVHRYLAILCICSLPGLTLAITNRLDEWRTWGMEIAYGVLLVLILCAGSLIKTPLLRWFTGILAISILIRHARLAFEVFPSVFSQQFDPVFTPLSILFKSLELISAPVLYCFVLIELRIWRTQTLRSSFLSFVRRVAEAWSSDASSAPRG
jgi:hypothetical protein